MIYVIVRKILRVQLLKLYITFQFKKFENYKKLKQYCLRYIFFAKTSYFWKKIFMVGYQGRPVGPFKNFVLKERHTSGLYFCSTITEKLLSGQKITLFKKKQCK